MADRTVRVIIQGDDKLTSPAGRATRSLGGLGTAAKIAGGLITIAFAKRAVSAAADVAKLGAQSLMARDRLVAFAGGSARASAMMDALVDSSDGTIDRLTAAEHAARLLQMGMVDTADEMRLTGAIVGKLGAQTLTLEQRMQTFTMLLANQSVRRLDTFGLSVEDVTARQKELEAQGYSTSDAFKTAVFEEAEVALETLGDTSQSAATKIARLEAAIVNAKTGFAELIVGAVESGVSVEALAQRIEGLAGTVEELYIMAVSMGVAADAFLRGEDAVAAFDQTIIDLAKSSATLGYTFGEDVTEGVSSFTSAMGQAVTAAEDLGDAELKAARAAATHAREILAQQVALRRRNEQLEDFARRAEELERSHQERLAGITASGQRTASEIARNAYNERLTGLNAALQAEASAMQAAQRARIAALRAAQGAEMDALREAQRARMDAVRAAMQAQLTALAEGIARRNFLQRLADMAQQHQDRLDAIRQQGADTATDIENRRFQDVMDNLNAEQKARLDALKARYGKGDDAGSKRESLEEEHRRRMLGLYTDSAREQERKRYEAALKELEYQEEEADLLEDFQEEKAAAEKAHRDELERIRKADLDRQVREEKARYKAAVAAAKRQERIRIEDANARRAITEQFAAIIEAMERRDRAEREAKEAEHNSARAAEAGRSDAEREAMEQNHNAQRVALANQLKAQLDAIRQAEIAQRIQEENVAHARAQEDLQRARNRADATWQDSLDRQRINFIGHLREVDRISEEMAAQMYLHLLYWTSPTGAPGHQAQPPEYAAGTSFHPGGLAIVGERGPELLDLPVGTSVTPISQAGVGASIVIHNYFGRGSIRSDRDVIRVVEEQEKAFRLRGVRTL